MPLFAATVFLSAFLLFQIQPVIAKQILPWFGGAAGVWIVCLVFFQLALLAGYLYADRIVRIRPLRLQAGVHIGMLALSVLWLPVIADSAWRPLDGVHPGLRIAVLLAATIGLPYLMLSTTAPIAQAWLGRCNPSALPYRLYSVANLAGVIGLAAYPFVIEPATTTGAQARWWSAAYGVFVVFGAAMTIQASRGSAGAVDKSGTVGGGVSLSERIWWLALAALPAALLLAVTNHLTENVASVPFLWLLPLCLYLLSYIICFGFERLYSQAVFLRLAATGLIAMAYLLWRPSLEENLRMGVAVFVTGLFLASMLCHGELVRRKPHPDRVTGFYMMVATGGAIGGLFVSVVAPLVFRGYFELAVVMFALALMTFVVIRRGRAQTKMLWIAVCLFVAVTLGSQIHAFFSGAVATGRNFYGSIRVVDFPSAREGETVRIMVHGTIDHGRQFLAPGLRDLPTSYYGRSSGIGFLLDSVDGAPRRVGVIGLGTGTVAAYGRPGDVFRFYEINPLVVDYARRYFLYLSDSRAQVEVVLGDGRLSLERETSQDFDVLAVDAFSGGSIPVHLLTKEAFDVYFSQLKPDGVLAMHVTNRSLDLTAVVARAAEACGATGVVISHLGAPERETAQTTWVLLARGGHLLDDPELRERSRPLRVRDDIRLWTDDYSNLFSILR